MPRDRDRSFEPELVKKGLTRIDGVDDNDDAKFWLSVMNALRNSGVQDILIAIVDGLKGLPEAITAAVPETPVQTCIVNLIRHSMGFFSWKDCKAAAADLRSICARFARSRLLRRPPASWTPLRRNGPGNTHPSPKLGAWHGQRLSPSMLSAPRSERSSTPRTPWSR